MVKCQTWGFDLTDFPSYKDWTAFLKRNKCKLQKTRKLYGDYNTKQFGHSPSHYLWKCNDVRFTTTHPGKATKKRPDLDGALGYVGVEFKDRSKWDKIRRDFVQSTSYIKEETRCESGFVSTPSIIEKRKPMKF